MLSKCGRQWRKHTVWPMSWLKLVYAGSSRPGCSGRCQRWPLIYHGVLIECSRMVDSHDEVTQCSTTAVDRGLNRQQTSTSLSCHSQKKAALHRHQWGLEPALLPKPWKIQKPWSRCTSQSCPLLAVSAGTVPSVSQCQRLQPFLVFFLCMCTACIFMWPSVFFFFWGGKRWGGVGQPPFLCPTAASLAVGWNNIYRLFSKMLWGWTFLAEEDLSQVKWRQAFWNGALPKHFQPGPKLNSLWIMFLGQELSAPSVPFICS